MLASQNVKHAVTPSVPFPPQPNDDTLPLHTSQHIQYSNAAAHKKARMKAKSNRSKADRDTDDAEEIVYLGRKPDLADFDSEELSNRSNRRKLAATNTLFVTQLPHYATDAWLYQLFSLYGGVYRSNIMSCTIEDDDDDLYSDVDHHSNHNRKDEALDARCVPDAHGDQLLHHNRRRGRIIKYAFVTYWSALEARLAQRTLNGLPLQNYIHDEAALHTSATLGAEEQARKSQYTPSTIRLKVSFYTPKHKTKPSVDDNIPDIAKYYMPLRSMLNAANHYLTPFGWSVRIVYCSPISKAKDDVDKYKQLVLSTSGMKAGMQNVTTGSFQSDDVSLPSSIGATIPSPLSSMVTMFPPPPKQGVYLLKPHSSTSATSALIDMPKYALSLQHLNGYNHSQPSQSAKTSRPEDGCNFRNLDKIEDESDDDDDYDDDDVFIPPSRHDVPWLPPVTFTPMPPPPSNQLTSRDQHLQNQTRRWIGQANIGIAEHNDHLSLPMRRSVFNIKSTRDAGTSRAKRVCIDPNIQSEDDKDLSKTSEVTTQIAFASNAATAANETASPVPLTTPTDSVEHRVRSCTYNRAGYRQSEKRNQQKLDNACNLRSSIGIRSSIHDKQDEDDMLSIKKNDIHVLMSNLLVSISSSKQSLFEINKHAQENTAKDKGNFVDNHHNGSCAEREYNDDDDNNDSVSDETTFATLKLKENRSIKTDSLDQFAHTIGHLLNDMTNYPTPYSSSCIQDDTHYNAMYCLPRHGWRRPVMRRVYTTLKSCQPDKSRIMHQYTQNMKHWQFECTQLRAAYARLMERHRMTTTAPRGSNRQALHVPPPPVLKLPPKPTMPKIQHTDLLNVPHLPFASMKVGYKCKIELTIHGPNHHQLEKNSTQSSSGCSNITGDSGSPNTNLKIFATAVSYPSSRFEASSGEYTRKRAYSNALMKAFSQVAIFRKKVVDQQKGRVKNLYKRKSCSVSKLDRHCYIDIGDDGSDEVTGDTSNYNEHTAEQATSSNLQQYLSIPIKVPMLFKSERD